MGQGSRDRAAREGACRTRPGGAATDIGEQGRAGERQGNGARLEKGRSEERLLPAKYNRRKAPLMGLFYGTTPEKKIFSASPKGKAKPCSFASLTPSRWSGQKRALDCLFVDLRGRLCINLCRRFWYSATMNVPRPFTAHELDAAGAIREYVIAHFFNLRSGEVVT